MTSGAPVILLALPAADLAAARAMLDPGFRAFDVSTVEAALDVVAAEAPDVIVIDALELGGLATLARAREMAPELPAVLVDGDSAAALAAGSVTACLTHPLDGADFAEAVQRAVDLSRVRRLRALEVARLERRLRAAEAVRELHAVAGERAGQHEVLDLAAQALARIVAFDVAEILVVPEAPHEPEMHLRRQAPCDARTLLALHPRCAAELAERGGRPPGIDTIAREISGLPESPETPHLRSQLHVAIERGAEGRPLGMISAGSFREATFGPEDVELVQALATEVSELLRRLSSRIVDERRKMALMVESMADGVIMTDERSEVFLINPAARRMLGLGRDVAVTAKYLKERLGFYPFDLVARAHAAREELTVEDKILHSIVSPVLDGTGKLVGVVVVLRDITEWKELEQRKEEFVSIVSHELRTPLTSIAGALDIVLQSYVGGLSDKQRTYLTMARESCSKLHVMVNDLLDVARFERGKMSMALAPCSLDELALECVDRFRASAEAKRVTMRFRVDRDRGGVRIVGDADRLAQVLNNLLSNAIKFTPEGGRIEVEVFGPGVARSHVGVSVWNNGDPIPEEHHERIFDKFEQVNASATRRVGGTGLGLAISRAIVEGHGGKIWVEHARVGTRFVFTLPAAPGEDHATPPHTASQELAVTDSEPAAAGTTGRQVLVIDDDYHAAYLLKGVLMTAGHRVHVAHDVDDALGWAREHKPDLVIVDVRMRGVDGIALVEILRHDPDTRRAGVVVVSADADRESALLAGADAYFTKPVEVDPLRATCMRILAEKARESHTKILVVDDDAGIRMICREVLEKAGYVVREAGDGMSALAEAKRFRPDLMLLDVMMPDLDGFQTVKRFRADRDGAMTPVIFVSARGQIADKVRAFKLGAEDYVVKPFDSMELVARVEKALERRERELGASPTTKLPGAGAIETEIERRLAEGGDFAFCYVDLDNLKAFNDYYGIAKADGVIRQTGDLMRQVVAREGTPNDFIGHIAGDDFVFITTPERADRIAQNICSTFDRLVPLYYDKADRERGYIETFDRYGQLRKFPLLSVSVAALTTYRDDMRFRTYADLAQASAEAKKRAKAVEGSSYVRDGAVVHAVKAKSVA
jgi:signal transduction histidine kinase/DNA-binding response OmpR family regulator